MKLYNSYTNTKETLNIKNNKVSMYVCGPTVYNYIHLGNIRPTILFDVLRRVMEFKGIEVNHTSNFTDIDDKIIKQSIIQKTTEKAISEKYIKAYIEDTTKLNLLEPHNRPLVTESMNDIIRLIDTMVKNKTAYIAEKTGDVYFDISKSKNYGVLANIKINELIEKSGNRFSEEKLEEGGNFALWKLTKEGITFDSPWGKGRPGWHTECVAMIKNIYSNQSIDIQAGGLDLKFPHHVNAIAQWEATSNKNLAKIWIHNGLLNFGYEKMSKSLGNTVLVKESIKKWGMEPIKLFFLSTHYQKPLKYTEQELEQQQKIWKKIKNVLDQIKILGIEGNSKNGKFIDDAVGQLSDNLNTSNTLTVLFAAMKKFNILNRESKPEAKNIAKEILSIVSVLGLI